MNRLLNAEPPGNCAFFAANHPSQQPFFHKPFHGQGIYLAIEVDDVGKLYQTLKKKGVPISVII
jgi:hypothetical protein